MARSLSLNVLIAGGVFWALMAFLDPAGLSVEGFANTFFRMLIFTMIYAAIQVALILFKRKDK